MSKFDEIMSQYANIIEELAAVPQQLDLTTLDKATGEQIQAGLAELMGNNQEQMDQVLQGLVNSKSINPNPQAAAPAQQPATSNVSTQGGTTQTNPNVTPSERGSFTTPAI
tara:strand:+ start:888 stop:1220 length:333 start_codon:yes stop_codon:yes gene_type:complete